MKNIMFIIAAVMLLISCGDNTKYTVTMTLPTSDIDGETVCLTNYDTRDTVATATVAGQVLTFEGTTEDDFLAALVVNGKRLRFVVEPGTITIDSEGKVTGTPLNEALNTFNASIEEIEAQAYKLMEDYEAGTIDSLSCQAAIDSINTAYSDAFKTTYEANKNNSLAIYTFINYAQMKELGLEEIEAEIANSPVLAQSTRIGNILDSKRNEAKTAEGAMFTDFTITNENGQEQKLSDYVGKGNYVLADFWASWCGPCRAEIPYIKKVYEKYNGKGLEVLGIAVWDKPADTQKAINDLQIPWQQITNAQSVPTDIYGINGIPHIILFGPDGTIVARGLRGDDMIARIDALMSEKK